jgi:flagellar biosynthesis/type III secretory pathway M-ring protein FliF/YscJ
MKIKIGVVIIILVGITAGVVVLAAERSVRMDKKQKEAAAQKNPEDEQKAREERKAAEEREAANLLSTAKLQIESNKLTAKIMLQELVRHRPDTMAAEEARTLLTSWKD